MGARRLCIFTRVLDEASAAERHRLATEQIALAERCGFDFGPGRPASFRRDRARPPRSFGVPGEGGRERGTLGRNTLGADLESSATPVIEACITSRIRETIWQKASMRDNSISADPPEQDCE